MGTRTSSFVTALAAALSFASSAFADPTSLDSGRLSVASASPGTVYLDDGAVGRAPTVLPRVPVGSHRVRVEFDDGGNYRERVTMLAGADESIVASRTEARKIFDARKWASLGLTVEGMAIVDAADAKQPGTHTISDTAVRVTPYVNVALAPAFEMRFGPQASIGSGRYPLLVDKSVDRVQVAVDTIPSGTMLTLGGSLSFRFNLGTRYTIALGASGGALGYDIDHDYYDTSLGGGRVAVKVWAFTPYAVGEFTPIALRFGSRRELEVSYTAAFGAATEGPVMIFSNVLGVSYTLPGF